MKIKRLNETSTENSYDIQYFQVFSNPKKPTDNGKMIAQAGTFEEAHKKGKKLAGENNYFIKAVCDDGKVRYIDNNYNGPKLNESKHIKEAIKPSGYDKCYEIVKKARTSNPVDTGALNDARDQFGDYLYRMCLDDVLKEMNESVNESQTMTESDTNEVPYRDKIYTTVSTHVEDLKSGDKIIAQNGMNILGVGEFSNYVVHSKNRDGDYENFEIEFKNPVSEQGLTNMFTSGYVLKVVDEKENDNRNALANKQAYVYKTSYALPNAIKDIEFKYNVKFEKMSSNTYKVYGMHKDVIKFAEDYDCVDDVVVFDNLEDTMTEAFKPKADGIQSVKVYNAYNYTIQELRIDNDKKTFERGNFTMGKPDKKTKNRQEFEDIVDELKKLGYEEVSSDYHSLRNKTRKGIPTNEDFETKTGYWSVSFDITVDGEDSDWDSLSETTRQHILNEIGEGYTNGELVESIEESITESEKVVSMKESYWIENKEVMDEVSRLEKQLVNDGWNKYTDKYTGSKYYSIFSRRWENGGEFKAVKYNHDHTPEIVDLSYRQIIGDEPLDSFDGLRKSLGRMLLPKNESVEAFGAKANKSKKDESKSITESEDKYVIYKENGTYKGTPKSNYGGRTSNARLIQSFDDFESSKEVIDYLKKYTNQKSDDDYEIIDESSEGFQKEFYNGYVILKNRAGDGWDIYSYDGTPDKVTKAYLEDEGYATLKDAKAMVDVLNNEANSMNESKSIKESVNIEDYRNELQEYIDNKTGRKQYFFVDSTFDGKLCIEINWGDWKHEHAYADYLVREFFKDKGMGVEIYTDVTEDDGSDAYSAIHYYTVEEPLTFSEPISLKIMGEDTDTGDDEIFKKAVEMLYRMNKFVLDVYDNESWLVYGVPDGEFEEDTVEEAVKNYKDHLWLVEDLETNSFDEDDFRDFIKAFKSATRSSDYDKSERELIVKESEELLA